ncbi:MAG TPA: L-threonylcarbamoyladenylate synthase, partial [Ilumatobacteraceae bacterium]|nr:L-threonylcarbamoyladenylate synthase [Ilumatobacteraceae bacterium]
MSDVDRALDVLRAGGLVAIPTETVYGLAADASNPSAVRRIFAVKRRPVDHPLIVHIATSEQLGHWASTIPPAAAVLADACWPGPLTLLVPRAASVIAEVTGGRETVGVRVPAHALTLELLHRFGGGLAAPSANRFGRVSPTTAAHVRADLGDEVDFVLDGGPCPIGVESTIVDCTVDPPQVLRPGGISNEDIAGLLDV